MKKVKLTGYKASQEVDKLFLIVHVTFSYFIGKESRLNCEKNIKVITAIQFHFQGVGERGHQPFLRYIPLRFYSFVVDTVRRSLFRIKKEGT